jgi:pyridoxal phosphate enzyme (YggS family)
MTVADNVRRIRERIAEAALKAGREPEEILLVAAAKLNPAERVREAVRAGVDAVGENRVQEMLLQNEQGAYAGAPRHFIGRLQSNKVRNVVGLCQLIESVDSVSLIEQIDKKANLIGIKQDILIEVNIGREGSKSGILPENLESLTDRAEQSPGVRVRGLMAIPPLDADLSQTRHYFDEMFKLFVDIRAKKYDNISMNFLSMGMSDSYIEAIYAGANIVRVGTAIFGERH